MHALQWVEIHPEPWLSVTPLMSQCAHIARNDKSWTGKRTKGSITLTEKPKVKPILQKNASFLFFGLTFFVWSQSADIVGSTGWFISILSDWPFMDFLALLCSKIGPFGCPHAVLKPCWAVSCSSKRFCKAVSYREDPPTTTTHNSSPSRSCDLHFTYESSRSLWTRISANYSFLLG